MDFLFHCSMAKNIIYTYSILAYFYTMWNVHVYGSYLQTFCNFFTFIVQVFPTANPAVLDQLSNVDCIVYAMGSLFTSICPSLVTS